MRAESTNIKFTFMCLLITSWYSQDVPLTKLYKCRSTKSLQQQRLEGASYWALGLHWVALCAGKIPKKEYSLVKCLEYEMGSVIFPETRARNCFHELPAIFQLWIRNTGLMRLHIWHVCFSFRCVEWVCGQLRILPQTCSRRHNRRVTVSNKSSSPNDWRSICPTNRINFASSPDWPWTLKQNAFCECNPLPG